MALISVTANTTNRDELAEARAFLDLLLQGQHEKERPSGPPRRGQSAGDGDEALASLIVDDLWSRIGTSLREVMSSAASFDGEFSLRDLAEELGEDMGKVKSKWANLGRSLNASNQAVPEAPGFFKDHDHPGDLWHFSMTPAIRSAVRLKDVGEPRRGRAGR